MKKILLLLLLLLPILSFSQVLVPSSVHIYLDQYMPETSWDIKDTAGNIVAADGPYYNAVNYQTMIIPVMLPEGDLVFTIYDSYGDGLNGSLWGGLDGSYYVKQCNDTLVFGTDPAFGNDSMHFFVSDACPPVMGCMDPAYVEFNHLADTDDGSCNILKVFGCTDNSMFNYDPLANTMALIPNCDYVLTLTDLIGDGWQASYLEVKQDTNTWYYSIDTALYTQDFIINLKSPMPVEFKFHITQQAALTASHCGFKLTNPLGDIMIEVLAPFIQPLFKYKTETYCGNYCIDRMFGCMDTLALNYVDTANTGTDCFYVLGCTSSAYLEYYTQGFIADTSDNSCLTPAVWGCNDNTAFNYNPLANIDNGGCIPVILGCMESLAFNFNALANTPDTCTPLIYGCTDPTMFNYCGLCNTSNGDCDPYVFGCTDSVMFNYNPLANADNSSCTPFIFGCTDPSMLNYDPLSNTEDFTCIEFVYGCMDEEAFNYDPMANTENESCITIVEGCMDLNAYNYSVEANVSDNSCLYDAGCITGPGIPYWLNDACYAWVISVDDYCCDNNWDAVCQLTYDYCDGAYVGPLLSRVKEEKKLISITDILGRPSVEGSNKLLFYIYDDGTVEKKIKQ